MNEASANKLSESHESIALTGLPPLPSLLRYYDDFEDKTRTLRDLKGNDIWRIQADGEARNIDFTESDALLKDLNKHIAASLLSRLDIPNAVDAAVFCIRSEKHLLAAISNSCAKFRDYWINEIYPSFSSRHATQMRACINALCDLAVAPWNPDLKGFVSQLPAAKSDIYKSVRTGECFLPLNDQSKLINYIDEMAENLRQQRAIDPISARDICILVISHQYGFRPGQIARILISDVTKYKNGAVHIGIPLLKQKGINNLSRVVRKIKHEWTLIFDAHLEFRSNEKARKGVPEESLFLLTPKEVGRLIGDVCEEITGIRWTATDLRHTAAQRLADSGASRLSIAEFMGHRSILTAEVYIDASPNQAKRINQALGISPIYSTLADSARRRTLNPKEILRYGEDHQIAALPHGIPIAGIGACEIGQPQCAKSPVLSCYTCRNFLPVASRSIHEEVVSGLRSVVAAFVDASRGDQESPAFTQLRRTITAAQSLIDDIEGGNFGE